MTPTLGQKLLGWYKRAAHFVKRTKKLLTGVSTLVLTSGILKAVGADDETILAVTTILVGLGIYIPKNAATEPHDHVA